MGKTIIQTIGPLYGEVVNGTVFGRPNGSIFVPATNTIVMSGNTEVYVRTINDVRILWGVNRVNIVAQAQDLASAISLSAYSDSDLTDEIATRTFTAGNFNLSINNLGNMISEDDLTPGATYYLVATLVNRGVAVATSSVLEVVAQ